MIAGASFVFAMSLWAASGILLLGLLLLPVWATLMAALAWQDAVDTVVCGDDVASGRPAPDLIHEAMANVGVTEPLQVATVGDTSLDLEAGAAAGVGWNIGVLSGAHGRDALERSPHTHILGSVADLRPLWRL